MHRWAAHAMVLVVILHMVRVFYTGAYKPPREFNWILGVVLLLLTLGASFTGYLIPWDQLSYCAITVGTNIAGYAPMGGEAMRQILLGGWRRGWPKRINSILHSKYRGSSRYSNGNHFCSHLEGSQRWRTGHQ
jgi:hypothetical protein